MSGAGLEMSGSRSGRGSGRVLPWRGLGEVQEEVQKEVWEGLGQGLGGFSEGVWEGSEIQWLAGCLAKILKKHWYLTKPVERLVTD